jgi:hypothetical protein
VCPGLSTMALDLYARTRLRKSNGVIAETINTVLEPDIILQAN